MHFKSVYGVFMAQLEDARSLTIVHITMLPQEYPETMSTTIGCNVENVLEAN